MQLFHEALNAAARADKLLNSINNSNMVLRNILDKMRLEVLSRSNELENIKEAVQIGERVSIVT